MGADKSTCHAAALIKMCRTDEKLKRQVSVGEHGLLNKHILQCEHAWTEEELYGKGIGVTNGR